MLLDIRDKEIPSIIDGLFLYISSLLKGCCNRSCTVGVKILDDISIFLSVAS